MPDRNSSTSNPIDEGIKRGIEQAHEGNVTRYPPGHFTRLSATEHLRELCKHGIGLNECDLAAAVPALLDLVERQADYIDFLGERLSAHEGVAWARTGQAADPRHVNEGIRLRDAIADAARQLPQGEPE